MKLTKIHLSGFKSFADATDIDITASMTGIVGPNGCGKSNIVDAIRWTMGETSRHIRATSLEDVIFSGTSTRKPVGQASLELVFDNTDGSIGGQYADYNELSLRRTVSRNNESKYYINNTRCRRRDIADIFFGTGLGTNSYAIIEQGMITRVVEAKPEEMRVHIEEAAGISRYKERRHETENRIRHTRDNLDRVLDIQEEVEKQLRKLKRQVGEAERFKKLRHQKDRLSAECLLLNLRASELKRGQKEKDLSDCRVALDKNKADLRAVEAEFEVRRSELDDNNEKLNIAKESVYRLDAKAASLEREISSQKRSAEQFGIEKTETAQALSETAEESRAEQEKLLEFERTATDLSARHEQLNAEVAERKQAMEASQEELRQLQNTFSQHHKDSRESSEALKVEQTRSEFHVKTLADLESLEQDIAGRRQALNIAGMESELAELRRRLKDQSDALSHAERMVRQSGQSVIELRDKVRELHDKLNEGQIQVQAAQGRLSSLEVLQEAQLGHDEEAFNRWLDTSGLAQTDLVSENIKVESGWENVIETVVGTFLEGVKVNALDEHTQRLADFKQGNLLLLESDDAAFARAGSLADKVSAGVGLKAMLSEVLIADSVEDAMARRASLKAGESLVTRDGIWVGRNWIKVRRFSQSQEGVLTRRQKIESLRHRIQALLSAEETVKDTLNQSRRELDEQEVLRDQNQQLQNEAQKEVAALETGISHLEDRIAREGAHAEELEQKLNEVQAKRDRLKAEYQQTQQAYDEALGAVQAFDSDYGDLESRIARQRSVFGEKQRAYDELREVLHKTALEAESTRVGCEASDRHIEQLKKREQELKKRVIFIDASLNDLENPLTASQVEYEQLVESRFAASKAVEEAEARTAATRAVMEGMETRRGDTQSQLDALQQKHEQAHADLQVGIAQCNDIHERLKQSDWDLAEIEAGVEPDVTLDGHNEKLQEIKKKLDRIGAVNLVALEEFDELSQRKEFIDAQCKDLLTALETLEKAIDKIDRETKERFRSTFEAVNANLRSLFPRLFGGGEAYLEMTDSDLLITGVKVMAKPPGKRLSSIQLMSGGEKALTAIAVVFAIFQLTPAPFCVLDEVDAPLDEHNIERFCDLIGELSQQVQFLVITHNKLTMEYMDCLLGITMYEAGVSRLVSVDMDEAVKMASA